jgi:hypothetical protein
MFAGVLVPVEESAGSSGRMAADTDSAPGVVVVVGTGGRDPMGAIRTAQGRHAAFQVIVDGYLATRARPAALRPGEGLGARPSHRG